MKNNNTIPTKKARRDGVIQTYHTAVNKGEKANPVATADMNPLADISGSTNGRGVNDYPEVDIEEMTEFFQDLIDDEDDEEWSKAIYDEARTQICQDRQARQDYEDDELVKDVSEPDGGFTVDVDKKQKVTRGFAYSPYPERSVTVDALNITGDDILGYIEGNRDLLTKEEHFLGAWHDPESGKVFLDVSVVTDDAKEARSQSEDNDQIAYFDFQFFKSVTVNKNATSGGAANS